MVDDVIAAVAASGLRCKAIDEAVALPTTDEMAPRGERGDIVGWEKRTPSRLTLSFKQINTPRLAENTRDTEKESTSSPSGPG
jgi:hypothetical protein